MKKFLLSLLLLGFYSQADAYFITVDAHAEECFFERVEVGTKMSKSNIFPPKTTSIIVRSHDCSYF